MVSQKQPGGNTRLYGLIAPFGAAHILLWKDVKNEKEF